MIILKSIKRKLSNYWTNIFLLSRLPLACPVCGDRSEVHCYVMRNDNGNNQFCCHNCNIIFTKEEPSLYKDIPSVQYAKMKDEVLCRR